MLEFKAYTSQTYALFADTQFCKAAHLLVADFNADQRSLEIEKHIVTGVLLARQFAVFVIVLVAEVGQRGTNGLICDFCFVFQ